MESRKVNKRSIKIEEKEQELANEEERVVINNTKSKINNESKSKINNNTKSKINNESKSNINNESKSKINNESKLETKKEIADDLGSTKRKMKENKSKLKKEYKNQIEETKELNDSQECIKKDNKSKLNQRNEDKIEKRKKIKNESEGIKNKKIVEIKKYIQDKLLNHKIELKEEEIVVMSDNKEIAYKEFLKSQDSPVFKEILKGSTQIFDIEIEINESKTLESLKEVSEVRYFYKNKHSLNLKLHDNFYPLDYLEFYKKLIISGRIKEIYFRTSDNEGFIPIDESERLQAYNEFISELKTLKLPLKIVYDEFFDHFDRIDTFIYLEESSKWPQDLEAVKCAVTAFYCQIFLQSRYRFSIDNNFVALQFKGIIFRIQIRFRSFFIPTVAFFKEFYAPQIQRYGDLEHYIRIFLAAHGYLDLFSPILIKIWAIYFKNSTPGRGFLQFINSGLKPVCYNLIQRNFTPYCAFSLTYNENTIKFDVDDLVLQRLRSLCNKIVSQLYKINLFIPNYDTSPLLLPCLTDYDLILSRNPMPGSSIITEISKNTFFKLDENLAYYFYSPYHEILMVKYKKPFKGLIKNYIIMNTGFKHCLEINH